MRLYLKEKFGGDDSIVKSTGCSSIGPRFDSQHPHGSSQQSVTPVPRDLIPSSGLTDTRYAHGTQTYMQEKHPHA